MSKLPSVVYDFDPRNLPAEFLRAVGLVVAASSQTEKIVQELIGGILQIDEAETQALTLQMSAPLRHHVARALMELNGANSIVVDQVDELLEMIAQANERRNIIVHNSFCIHPDTGEIYTLRAAARGSLQMSLQTVTAQQLESEAGKIYEAGIELMRFMVVFGVLPGRRTRPIREPLKRSKKDREARKTLRTQQ